MPSHPNQRTLANLARACATGLHRMPDGAIVHMPGAPLEADWQGVNATPQARAAVDMMLGIVFIELAAFAALWLEALTGEAA